MHRAIIVAMFVRFALAQIVTTPEQLPKSVMAFSPGAASGELPCAVEVLQPELNFGSRFQAGYVVRAPIHAYHGGGHHWDVVFRVTPQEGSSQPVLFTDSIDLPDDASSDAIEEVHGLFLLGEGQYHVKWSILDDLGRVFRKEWDLKAKAAGKERITMPAGMAGDLAWRSVAESPASASPQRVTLLVNVARTAGYPWTRLLAVLEPLVERLSTVSVRLVVFDLPKQRELFREDGFALNDMNRLVHATNWLTGRVDPGPFEHQEGVWDLLANLVNGEIPIARAGGRRGVCRRTVVDPEGNSAAISQIGQGCDSAVLFHPLFQRQCQSNRAPGSGRLARRHGGARGTSVGGRAGADAGARPE